MTDQRTLPFETSAYAHRTLLKKAMAAILEAAGGDTELAFALSAGAVERFRFQNNHRALKELNEGDLS